MADARTPPAGARHPLARGDVALAIVLSVVSLTLLAGSTLLTVAFTDYENEALPSITALLHGSFGRFLGLLPAYGGSLVMRAPAALLAHAAGGGELAVYRALAVPCLVAGAAFGLVLWGSLARRGARAGAWLALVVVVANPLILRALDMGHPEEYLGAVLCAAGVLAALRDRPLLAGLLLGAAGANKAWAILAVVPALVALRRGHLRLLATAGAVCAAVMAPAVLHGTQSLDGIQGVAQQAGAIFNPWQWTWFLGHHGAVVHGLYGAKPGYRAGPGWLAAAGHLPITIVPVALAGLAWARSVDRHRALLLLALCFLLRCVVDPWDTAYYHLPFLMALAGHEAMVRRRAPVAALLATAAVYGSTVLPGVHLAPDAQAALYLLWSLPAVVACGLAVFAPARTHAVAADTLRRLRSAWPSPAEPQALNPPPSAPSAAR